MTPPARTPRTRGRIPCSATLTVFGVLALLLWINAVVDSYRFNVAIAVLGSLPVLIVASTSAALHKRRTGPTAR